jgi:ergothioneine biosynthesis protein EgtB
MAENSNKRLSARKSVSFYPLSSRPTEKMDNEAPTELALLFRYRSIRRLSEMLCQGLQPEDCVVQSMPDASPIKWHLAHTTWFFEQFILSEFRDYSVFDENFAYLFNSYYNALGDRHCRAKRGLLTRPTLQEVFQYREHVNQALSQRLEKMTEQEAAEIFPIVEMGLQHEQQHQELMLTDLKHLFYQNPLKPVYVENPISRIAAAEIPELKWKTFESGLFWIGHESKDFSFDNEHPRHLKYLATYKLATRPVLNKEYLNFIEDGGYTRPELWLSDGWQQSQSENWQAPLYWEKRNDGWWAFTLSGLQPLHPSEPVCHVSYYEADAYARWAGARLPLEEEWEIAAKEEVGKGVFLETGDFHPMPLHEFELLGINPMHLLGNVWEWTASAYLPYPGYSTQFLTDASSGGKPRFKGLNEYNGKFMCNQMVMRGGSCVSPRSHIRSTYRNFFPPSARWQFSGIRLAGDI